jgi:hypothetical protein
MMVLARLIILMIQAGILVAISSLHIDNPNPVYPKLKSMHVLSTAKDGIHAPVHVHV